MSIFQRKFGPIFLKEDSEAFDFVEKMKKIAPAAPGELKEKIDKQIRLAEFGIYGENTISYE